MKANKKTLTAIKNFLQHEDGWDLDEIICDMVSETKMLKYKSMGDQSLAPDECSINWG